MGRTATGVWGIRLQPGDEVVGMEILLPGATILTVTANGYGKRTPLEDYRVQNRGGQGIITIRTTARNGDVVGVIQVVDDDQVMLITDGGQVLRCRVSGISTMGRATQGVRLMDLEAPEKIVSVARLAEREDASGTEVQPSQVAEPDPDALETDAEGDDAPLETDPEPGDGGAEE
jgi:DNA gyrase subunit A